MAYDLSDYPNVPSGTGARGHLFEYLLSLNGGNADLPAPMDVKSKNHSLTALLPMFHKERSSTDRMNQMVFELGWQDGHWRISFRYTLKKQFDRAFRV